METEAQLEAKLIRRINRQNKRKLENLFREKPDYWWDTAIKLMKK
jgi:hypothetical protein